MTEFLHTKDELKMKQSLPLSMKVQMTKLRLLEWVREYGIDGVYVSFSGGKDSTVLLDIAREMFPDIQAVYIDTGLEYPEIREHVKTFDNVVWLKPKMNFRKVIETYGYPFVSKELSNCVVGAKKYLQYKAESDSIATDRQTDRQTEVHFSKFRIPTTTAEWQVLANTLNADWGKVKGSPERLAIMLGMLDQKAKATIPSEGSRSNYSYERWNFLLTAPFNISDKCCTVMKKCPAKEYGKETGRHPITAQMAAESRIRRQQWLRNGCNAFNATNPISNPMSFWTEQDVLQYIVEHNLKICSVYGDVVTDYPDNFDNQISLDDLGLTDKKPTYKTTGCKRTGCMFCGYGCHLNNDDRFVRMKETHPKQYEWIMKPTTEGGLGYKDIIDWMNENGNLKIRY